MGRIDLALLSFNRVVELDPEMVIAHVRLSELYELQGNLEEAVRESEEAYLYLTDASSTKERMILARLQQLESRLNFRDGRHQGLLYLRKGSFREAEEAFREVLLIQPDQAEIHYLLGTVLGIQNRLEEAIERFQWSLRIKPDFIDSRMRLAELYQVKGEWVKARSELEKAAFFLEDRDGGEAQLIEARLDAVEDQVEIKELTDRSFQEIESGRTDAAVLTLQSLLKLNPEEPSVHFNLGNLWAQKSRLDLAEGAFKKAIELRPNDPQAHQRLGQVYELVRYYGRAKEEYEKARIGLSPDDPLQKELANAIARTEQETEAARASAETLGSQSEER
ncbi:MAG: tetratricopeptide repeat protein, partial [Candidatus Manganitrophaceae bacterium]